MERITVVVGSGFSGSILARKIAEDLNHRVIVLEKRSHIAGNMYDYYDENGILIQKYGPHFLNTNNYYIIEYLEQFADLFPHNTKLLSYIDGKYVRLPFNFLTVQQLVGAKKSEILLSKLRRAFKECDRVPILRLVENDDKDIQEFGRLLFEKSYRTYISKMWGVQPEKIDKYVLERVPMAINYDERYLNKDFQYLPKNGYTKLFESMLDHPNITIELNTDALEHIVLDEFTKNIFYDGEKIECLVFTGAIDELFGNRYGALPYRSIELRYDHYEEKSHLPSEIVSYPQAAGYTRRTEYRKLMYKDKNVNGTTVVTEYPLTYNPKDSIANIPYYPVVTNESNLVYDKYLSDAKEFPALFLCGRLAEFKYYNMDVCIEHALLYFENIKKYLAN